MTFKDHIKEKLEYIRDWNAMFDFQYLAGLILQNEENIESGKIKSFRQY
jgi:hypothetical protein